MMMQATHEPIDILFIRRIKGVDIKSKHLITCGRGYHSLMSTLFSWHFEASQQK
ncbi:Uncharacterised protein [Porphyromonas macacae]|uniref:Uncharacterized protein n=1 Tax=Porphyromonas macacae TaxID=28115 RepID=A0A379EBD9_9PORP|nr:Uncharacterised protein [Porphyromonas macacae]